MSHSTHSRSFWGRVFAAKHLAIVLTKQTYNTQRKHKKPKLDPTKPNKSPVSIQTYATQALALRERKTQALALVTMISCFDRPFLLAGACGKILHNDRLRQLRDLCLRTFVFCLRNFLAFLAHFLFCLRIFSYARPCVRLNGNRA